jgi:chaperonin GroES
MRSALAASPAGSRKTATPKPSPRRHRKQSPALHDRLLVRRIQDQEKETANGKLLIPDTAKRKPWKGEVLAVGSDKDPEVGTKHALDVKVGDKVLFGRHSGIEVKVSGEDLLILPEHEFLVVLT